MKITIDIQGKPTEIVLSPDQVAEIKRTPVKITDRVKTLEDACRVVDIDPDSVLPSVSGSMSDHERSIMAYSQLVIIAQALNEGWKPDWSDSNQYKYTPYFSYKSGFGFSFTLTYRWSTDTAVGSRLCFKTRELAEYAGKQFEALYNDYLSY